MQALLGRNYRSFSVLYETTASNYVGTGMSSSGIDRSQAPLARRVTCSADELRVELADGRTLTVPLSWYPRLQHGLPAERENWELIGEGDGIHWPDLDEDLRVEGLLAGRRSGEGKLSFEHWLATRTPKD
jgi:hypothetical protein